MRASSKRPKIHVYDVCLFGETGKDKYNKLHTYLRLNHNHKNSEVLVRRTPQTVGIRFFKSASNNLSHKRTKYNQSKLYLLKRGKKKKKKLRVGIVFYTNLMQQLIVYGENIPYFPSYQIKFINCKTQEQKILIEKSFQTNRLT